MKLKEKAMIKALLSHFEQESALLRFLPTAWQQEIELLAPPQHLDFPSMLSSTKWLARIHYSWLHPHLCSLPVATQKLFLSLLTLKQRKGLAEMLKCSPDAQPLSPFATLYLSHYLKGCLQKEEVIPLPALPKSALNPLIKVTWSQLIALIDFLGLYDLACDYKQIVDRALIKKIFKALTKEQIAFVQHAAKLPTKWVSPKLGLQNWDGDCEKLHRLIHQRGLIRLTKGVVGEHLSFRWHLIHRLDMGRAKVMLEALATPIDQAHIAYFREQILTVAKMVVR